MNIKNKISKILDKSELSIIDRLNTPNKIQDFLDTVPFNFEKNGETYMSPRKSLREKGTHCFEGTIFAHLCLTYHGYKNYIIDLKVKNLKKDSDHTLAIFKINNSWGAISKTNHSVLRWRDPIFKNIEALIKSYFHEYFLDTGEKTLLSYSEPFNVFKRFGFGWVVSDKDLDNIAKVLDRSPHINFVHKENKKYIRKAGKTEIKGAAVEEWKK